MLREHVGSLEQLSILLHLHGEGTSPCTAAALTTSLNISADLAEEALAGLLAGGLVRKEGSGVAALWFGASTGTGLETMARLKRTYREHPVVILQLLSSYAIERVRTSAHRAFADAFIIRKGDRRG
ncbi:MAG TPA: hypothetical protein VHY75_01985 [Steroidobacteraceae bacterium]|jgi:hypothetical protein|nr:hypothetical protein [Steroidobacteraceae bacterium]